MNVSKPLVTPEFLFENLRDENLIILNGTLKKVTSKNSEEKKQKYQIENAISFDIKNVFSELHSKFPNTILSPNKFEEEAQNLGINKHSFILVYDDYGIYSSARVWWMFKLMGFNNIAVLDGGLPSWLTKGFPTELKQKRALIRGDFKVNYKPQLVRFKEDVLLNIETKNELLLDARSVGRFKATIPEPRKTVRSGHIPCSKSLPYSFVLNDVQMKKSNELVKIFNEINSENKSLIFSCGSGITACILALAAEVAGTKKYAVYDGSWTEWGSLNELPIEN